MTETNQNRSILWGGGLTVFVILMALSLLPNRRQETSTTIKLVVGGQVVSWQITNSFSLKDGFCSFVDNDGKMVTISGTILIEN